MIVTRVPKEGGRGNRTTFKLIVLIGLLGIGRGRKMQASCRWDDVLMFAMDEDIEL